MQDPLPPAQFSKPLSMRLMPMSMTVGPVTMGGKTRSIVLGGMKAISTSISAHTAAVPMRAP